MTSVFAPRQAPRRAPQQGTRAPLSLARARLLLGISGVGAQVLLAALVLTLDLPTRLLSTSTTQPLTLALAQVLGALGFVLLAFLLADLIGGALLVRQRKEPLAWLTSWLRGVAVQALVWLAAASLLMYSARLSGAWAAWLAFATLQLSLAAARGRMARLVAALPITGSPDRIVRAAERAGIPAARLRVVQSADEGFTGGWSGIRARRLLIPARWNMLPDGALDAALARAAVIGTSGAHTRGVLAAALWNITGFAVVRALTGAEPGSAAGLLTIVAGMTLWTFLAVLVLPSVSRRSAYAIDRATAARVRAADVQSAIDLLDRWQDDEPVRAKWIERIFHPVPARSERLARLASPDASTSTAWTTHHVARHALWLSWATLTPLARAVHCNVGRPELWVMLPSD